MTALKNKFKKIQAIVLLIENAEKSTTKNKILTKKEEVVATSELLLLQINFGENEFLFI